MTTTNNADPAAQAASGSDPQAQVATSASQADQSTQTSTVSLEELQRQLAEVKRESQGLRKRIRDQEAADQEAEQERLKKQGQFEELAKQHEARAKELEPKAARFEEMAERIRKQIKANTKDWPAEIKAFYPGDDADIMQLQDWYDRSQPLLEKLQTQQRAALPGNRPNPPAANRAGTQADADQRNRQAFVRQRSYGL